MIELSPDILLEARKQTKPIFVMAPSVSVLLYNEDGSFNLPKGEENILLKTFIGAPPFPSNQLYLITKAPRHTPFLCVHEAEELQIGFWILFGFLFPFPPFRAQ